MPLSQPGMSIPGTGSVGQALVSRSWGCSQRGIPKPRPCPAAAASGVPGSSLGIPDSNMGKPRESPLQVFSGDPTALEQWPGAEGQLAPGSPAPFPPESHIQGCSHSPRACPGCSTSLRLPKPSLSARGIGGAADTGKPPGPSTPNNFPFSQCQLTVPTQVMANQESSQPVVPNSDHLASSNPVSCFPRYFLTHPRLHLCLVAVPALGGDRGLHAGSRQDKAEGEWGS